MKDKGLPTPVSLGASDEELLVRYRNQHDSLAFETLVHRYEKPIFSYLARYLRSAELADEVFQSTFLRVHERCGTFDAGRRFEPWLYSIATHQAIDALRREGRHRSVRLDDPLTSPEGDARQLLDLLEASQRQPVNEAAAHEQAARARQAVDDLPDALRVAVLLVFFQGLKYREAAEALQIPEGTVKSRVHRALLVLHQALERERRGELA